MATPSQLTFHPILDCLKSLMQLKMIISDCDYINRQNHYT